MITRDFNLSIEFTNNGQISFFFLGVGDSFSKLNLQNNVLIVKGDDHILIDCGTLCPFAFSQYNSKITDVKNFLITHSHADHIGGLEEVALSNMYVTKTKPSLVITDKYKKSLWNKSLAGGLSIRSEENLRQKMTFDDYFLQIKPILIKDAPRPFYETSVGSINLKLFRTKHLFTKKNTWKNSFQSFGVLIDNKVLFTGDSQNDPELIEWLSTNFKIEAIFHDCQFFKNPVHASYEEICKTLPDNLKKITYLCHYSDNIGNIDVTKDGFAGLAKKGLYYDL